MTKFETIFQNIFTGFKLGFSSIMLALKSIKYVIVSFLTFVPFFGILFGTDYIKSKLFINEKLNLFTKIVLFLSSTAILIPCLMFGIAFTYYCARNLIHGKKKLTFEYFRFSFLCLNSFALFFLALISFVLPYIFAFFLKPLIGTIIENLLVSIFLVWLLIVFFAIPLIIENKNILFLQVIKNSLRNIKNNFFKIFGGGLFATLLQTVLYCAYLLFGYLSAIFTIGLSQASNIELIMTSENIFAAFFIFIFLFIHMLIWAIMFLGETIFITYLSKFPLKK